MTTRTFMARHDGRCPECGDDFTEGDLLRWSIEDRVIHADCDDTRLRAMLEPADVCPSCFIAKPKSGRCDTCD